MACPTGIREDERLKSYLSTPGHQNDRCIKIVIENEKLVMDQNRLVWKTANLLVKSIIYAFLSYKGPYCYTLISVAQRTIL